MKKIHKLIVLLISIFSLISCSNTEPINEELEKPVNLYIFSINDIHGACEDSDSNMGLARISTKINEYRNKYGEDNVIVLCGGDSFQGQFISNVTYGRAVLDCLNAMNIDGSTVGNHEFDWGIDTIKQYVDGNIDNGEASFPIGCANYYSKNPDKRVEDFLEYFTFKKGKLKIGVIPTIGYGQEADINGLYVEGHYFANPVPIINDLAKKLRNEEKCDVVIVDSHDPGYNNIETLEAYNINQAIANFTLDSRVDAVINAHSHYKENNKIKQKSGGYLYTVQGGCNSNAFGLITLTVDIDKRIRQGACSCFTVSSDVEKDPIVQNIVNKYVEETNVLSNKFICTMGESVYSTSYYYNWAVDSVVKETKVDVAITNQGGIRAISSHGSLDINDSFIVKDLYAVMPFDNAIMYTDITGKLIKEFINNYGDSHCIGYKSSLDYRGLVDSTIYHVAVLDYVAEKAEYSPIFKNDTYKVSGYLFRDILEKDMLKQQDLYGNFKASRGSCL